MPDLPGSPRERLKRFSRRRADVNWRLYQAPLDDRGTALVRVPGSAQQLIVSNASGRTFKPGTWVPTVRHQAGPGEVIVGMPSPSRRGAAAFSVLRRFADLGPPPAVEEPPISSTKSYIGIYDDGSSLHAWDYVGGQFQSVIRTDSYSGLFTSPVLAYIALCGATTKLIFGATGGADGKSVSWDLTSGFSVLTNAPTTGFSIVGVPVHRAGFAGSNFAVFYYGVDTHVDGNELFFRGYAFGATVWTSGTQAPSNGLISSATFDNLLGTSTHTSAASTERFIDNLSGSRRRRTVQSGVWAVSSAGSLIAGADASAILLPISNTAVTRPSVRLVTIGGAVVAVTNHGASTITETQLWPEGWALGAWDNFCVSPDYSEVGIFDRAGRRFLRTDGTTASGSYDPGTVPWDFNDLEAGPLGYPHAMLMAD